jgi:hypothetical protein
VNSARPPPRHVVFFALDDAASDVPAKNRLSANETNDPSAASVIAPDESAAKRT